MFYLSNQPRGGCRLIEIGKEIFKSGAVKKSENFHLSKLSNRKHIKGEENVSKTISFSNGKAMLMARSHNSIAG